MGNINSIIRSTIFRYLLILLFVIISTPLYYSQWFWQNPLTQGNSLNGTYFISHNTGWAVGDIGTILKTTDAGAVWTVESSITPNSLHGISFFDSSNGIIVGGNYGSGVIIRTSDRGNNWVIQSSFSFSLTGISCATDKIAFAVGDSGKIIKTTDAGINWVEQNSGTPQGLKSVSFLDSSNGIAVGYGASLNTINGGINWTLNNSIKPPLWLTNVKYTNINRATAVSYYGLILFSTDGGINWIQQYTTNYYVFFSVAFIDTLNGIAVGGNYPYEGGLIFRTSDGGNNWLIQENVFDRNLLSISFYDSKNGTITGMNGIIYRTSDGGYTWTKQWNSLINDQFSFNGVSFYDKNNGVVVGSNIFRTTDGGTTWIKPDSVGQFLGLSDVQFINSKFGTAVGSQGVILRTTDGGKNWFNQTSGYTEPLRKVSFSDVDNGYICGNGNSILKTTDGGNSWISKPTPSDYYTGISFTDANTGALAAGSLFRTTDGGDSWIQKSGSYRDVFFIDNNTGWAAGDEGVISHTTDGGTTWIEQNSGTNIRLWGICFSDKNNGTIIGAGYAPAAVILRTTNGGDNWIKQPDITGYELEDVCFTDAYYGTIVGLSGTILHTTNGGISFVENDKHSSYPNSFVLYQNYPNPFNPSTTIKFNISLRAHVFLGVYDVLGRLVRTLVDEELKPGDYTKEFTPSNLSSGIYIFRLITPSGTNSKKMMFIK